jgi:hypothetical protein
VFSAPGAGPTTTHRFDTAEKNETADASRCRPARQPQGAVIIQLLIVRFRGLSVRNSRQVNYNIHTPQQGMIRFIDCQIHGQRWRAIFKSVPGPAQGHQRITPVKQLLAKLLPDKTGRATNEAFHSILCPEKGGKSPLMIRMPRS